EIPLEFLKPLHGQTLQEEEKLILECEVSKADRAATWYRDGEEITPKDGVKLISDGTHHKLIIDSVTVDDEADYTVKIDDKSSKAMVLVEGELDISQSSLDILF
ncbi:hypothetical protein LOTGIDRAFT_141542, partial [Lottia gigantea]